MCQSVRLIDDPTITAPLLRPKPRKKRGGAQRPLEECVQPVEHDRDEHTESDEYFGVHPDVESPLELNILDSWFDDVETFFQPFS